MSAVKKSVMVACGFCFFAAISLGYAQSGGYPWKATTPVTYTESSWRPFFEANSGDFPSDVLFFSKGKNYLLLLKRNSVTVEVANPADKTPDQTSEIAMTFVCASPWPAIAGEAPLPGKVRYSIEGKREYRREVTGFSRIQYKSLFPGVDMYFTCSENFIEYSFALAPQADIHNIVIEFGGAAKLAIDENGGLLVQTPLGTLTRPNPTILEKAGKEMRPLKGGYVLLSDNRVGFETAGNSQYAALVIDPVLIYYNPSINWSDQSIPINPLLEP